MRMLVIKSLFSSLLVGCALMMHAGCREETASRRLGVLPSQMIEDNAICYFSPVSGEIWKYRVEKAIPLGVSLSPADARRHTKSTDVAQLITFEQTRRCNGRRNFEGVTPALTAVAIMEDDKLLGEEFYEIHMDGVFSWGWIPDDMKADGAQLLEKGVPLAKAPMCPGQSWESNGRKSGEPFLFKVIERRDITVPAGTFRATRIQITNESSSANPVTGEEQATSLKRSLWLAEDVGIVKEEIVYYSGGQVTVKQTSELVQWILPIRRNSDEIVPADPRQEAPAAIQDRTPENHGYQIKSERPPPLQPLARRILLSSSRTSFLASTGSSHKLNAIMVTSSPRRIKWAAPPLTIILPVPRGPTCT